MIHLFAVRDDKWEPKHWPKEKEEQENGNNGPQPNHLISSCSRLTVTVGTSEFHGASSIVDGKNWKQTQRRITK